jgi:excinuclease ABC subunit C
MTDKLKKFDHKYFLKNTPALPGVYDMRDKNDNTLYIGKAKNLKARLSSYFSSEQSIKTNKMLSKLTSITTTATYSEKEALILEQNLIKQKKPPYNILLRDDKSYPFILISNDKFPKISSYRSKNKQSPGKLFGPFPSYLTVTKQLQLLQNLFKIRPCSNAFFRNRTRPCLQYQINKCKAPCVGLVSLDEYQNDIDNACDFLNGKSQHVINNIIKQIEQNVVALNFEEAKRLRDLLRDIRELQEQQSVEKLFGNADVIGFASELEVTCFNVLFVRNGKIIDHCSYSPKYGCQESKQEQLEAFLSQYYIALAKNRNFPDEIILPFKLKNDIVIEDTLKSLANKKVSIKHKLKAIRQKWLNLAMHNAQANIKSFIDKTKYHAVRWQQLKQLLKLTTINHIECFDISHSKGEATIASCVVYDNNGPVKQNYRKFNINIAKQSDDYGAIYEAVIRRFNSENNKVVVPELLLIDGGKGQLSATHKALEYLNIKTTTIAIAKGAGRKPGLETIFHDNAPLDTTNYPQAFLLLQEIRDAAHRFAITAHRKKRRKIKQQSLLEEIPGIGATRRNNILKFFGGYQGVCNASIEEIAKIKNINMQLATSIYNHLHKI